GNEENATEDTLFTCTINATDEDAGAGLIFTANYTWFAMNSSNITVVGGVAETTVNFTPSQSEVGNYTINITVSDGYDNVTTLINFSVIQRNDPPNLSSISGQIAYTFMVFTLNVNATDEENDTIYYYDNSSLFEINISTGIISFTANESHVGTHWINITASDLNSNSSILLNISVYNNTAPSCSDLSNFDRDLLWPEMEFSMLENESTGTFMTDCKDAEGDDFTYNWYWNGTINSTGDRAVADSFSRFVTFYEEGVLNLTLYLNDRVNRTRSYYWNITINHTNAPPVFDGPIANHTAGWFQNRVESINLSSYFSDLDEDNLTYTWYYYAINESFHSINLTMTYNSWGMESGNWTIFNASNDFVFNQSNSTVEAVNTYANFSDATNITAFTARIKLFDSGAAGLCYLAEDANCSTALFALLNATDNKTYWYEKLNGSIISSNNSYSYNFSLNTSYWIKVIVSENQSDVYISPNGTTYEHAFRQNSTLLVGPGRAGLYTSSTRAFFDDIVLKSPEIEYMTITLNGSSGLFFTPAADWYGASQIVIAADDGNYTTDSNVFYLTVYEAQSTPQVVVQTSSSSSTSTSFKTQIAAMSLIVPALISLEPMGTTLVPVIINNTGEIPITKIMLQAMTNESEIFLRLDDMNFTGIPVGGKVSTQLEIKAGLLLPARYTVKLEADSEDPILHEEAEIIVDVRERDAALITQIREQIQFTRDLFLQNPECMELSELIDEAERLLELRQFDRALELLHQANQGCKDFISQERGQKTEIKQPGFFKRYYKTIILEVSALLLIMMLLMYYFKRRSYAAPLK
ncbi:MAG: hypothetical protein ABIB71_00965, partial [Candidatus Woesearchaeota archaeon]